MALDKLVDSARLDADLASVADAIRAKGGTSAQLAFPTGFVDAVEAIETGGSSGASGSVTVAQRTVSLTIDMGGEYDHIIVAQRSGTGNQYRQDNSRYAWLAVGIRGYSAPTNSNAHGALIQATNATTGYGATIANATCAFSGSTVTFTGSNVSAAGIAFSPYVTYDWWAW